MKILNLKFSKIALVAIALGFLVNSGVFCLSLGNHWVDADTGLTESSLGRESSHLVSVKYDYGFPLRFWDNAVAFGGHVDWVGIHLLWLNFLVNVIFWSVGALVPIILVRVLKRPEKTQ